jgi:LacI family transcriptional regulator
MRKHRVPAEYISLSANTRAAARADIKSYVEEHGCPDGILCFNDEVALGSYRALCDLGIKMPQKVALIGCDGIEDTEFLECPITTIVQPVEEMCNLAWDILQERIVNPRKELTQKVLLSQLAIRDSSLYFGGKSK